MAYATPICGQKFIIMAPKWKDTAFLPSTENVTEKLCCSLVNARSNSCLLLDWLKAGEASSSSGSQVYFFEITDGKLFFSTVINSNRDSKYMNSIKYLSTQSIKEFRSIWIENWPLKVYFLRRPSRCIARLIIRYCAKFTLCFETNYQFKVECHKGASLGPSCSIFMSTTCPPFLSARGTQRNIFTKCNKQPIKW